MRFVVDQPALGGLVPSSATGWPAFSVASGMTPEGAFEWHNTLVVDPRRSWRSLLVAAVPFTKLRHMFNGPLNILVRPSRPIGALRKDRGHGEHRDCSASDKMTEFTPQQLLSFDACLKCGRCQEALSRQHQRAWTTRPRDLVQMMRTGDEQLPVDG